MEREANTKANPITDNRSLSASLLLNLTLGWCGSSRRAAVAEARPASPRFVVNIAITSVIEHFSTRHVLELFAAHAIFTNPGVKNCTTILQGIQHLGLLWRKANPFLKI